MTRRIKKILLSEDALSLSDLLERVGHDVGGYLPVSRRPSVDADGDEFFAPSVRIRGALRAYEERAGDDRTVIAHSSYRLSPLEDPAVHGDALEVAYLRRGAR